MLRKIRGKLEESLLLKACARALQGSLEKLPKENLVTSGPEVARKTETVAEMLEPPLPVPIQKRGEAPPEATRSGSCTGRLESHRKTNRRPGDDAEGRGRT